MMGTMYCIAMKIGDTHGIACKSDDEVARYAELRMEEDLIARLCALQSSVDRNATDIETIKETTKSAIKEIYETMKAEIEKLKNENITLQTELLRMTDKWIKADAKAATVKIW